MELVDYGEKNNQELLHQGMCKDRGKQFMILLIWGATLPRITQLLYSTFLRGSHLLCPRAESA